ncbi:MAG: ERCC4 domain-containing protein [Candidatus Methanofastidiosia archaeon]
MRKPNPPPYLYPALKAQAAALKLHHGILLLETQGIDSLLSYFKRLESQKTKSAREIVNNQQVKRAMLLARNIKLKHPKLTKLSELISENRDKQIIVFSHYRDSAKKITEMLSELEGVRAVRFVGQASKQNDIGLTQKKQKEIIESFKEGNYNVLVATSVAEEGLDIPQVDLVIFYEPVPSEIRAIQRRGRTGRRRSGEVVVLITRETRDEGFYYTARRKEQKMKKLLEGMRAPEEKPSEKQASLDEFSPNIKIICDSRESSSILKKLSEKVKLEIKNLEVGDYVLSERIGVERKTTEDFLKSLIDGRLFSQIRELKQSYLMPLMILEGDDIYNLRKISRNAIQTALISVMCDFKVPVLFTKTEEESAEFLISLAKREQLVKKREVVARGEKKPKSLKERQRFIVEGLPQVSAVLAERLLSRFKTVRDVFKATEEELKNVEGIGKKISREIRDVLDMEWEG